MNPILLRTALVTAASWCTWMGYGAARSQQNADHNGTWWLAQNGSFQEEFIAGYVDCSYHDVVVPDHWDHYNEAALKDSVTAFYKQKPSRQNTALVGVLHALRGAAVPRSHRMREYNSFDGDEWRVMGWPTGQTGFVDGFLYCHKLLRHEKSANYSQPVSTYVSLISKWYGFNPADGDMIFERQQVRIRDVLFRFRDASRETTDR